MRLAEVFEYLTQVVISVFALLSHFVAINHVQLDLMKGILKKVLIV